MVCRPCFLEYFPACCYNNLFLEYFSACCFNNLFKEIGPVWCRLGKKGKDKISKVLQLQIFSPPFTEYSSAVHWDMQWRQQAIETFCVENCCVKCYSILSSLQNWWVTHIMLPFLAALCICPCPWPMTNDHHSRNKQGQDLFCTLVMSICLKKETHCRLLLLSFRKPNPVRESSLVTRHLLIELILMFARISCHFPFNIR